jgi:hypothetical protein
MTRSVSTVHCRRPRPAPAPVPPEDMGVLQWILYGLRTLLVWLIEIIDGRLAR